MHKFIYIIIHSSNTYQILFVHTYVICHEKHTANIQMKISEHGAYP